MASFSDINSYIESARQAHEHLDSYKNDIVASKVGDIKERYEAAISKVSQFGQATTGASAAFHLGRKIYKKQKAKYGKDPAKEKKAEAEGEQTGEEPVPEGVTEYKNPAFDPESLNEGQNISKEPARTEPNEGEGNEPDTENVTGGRAKVSEEDIPEGAGGGEDVSNLGQRGGLSVEDAQKFTQGGDTAGSTAADNVANNVSGGIDEVSNAASRTASSALDGAGDAAKAGLNSFKKAGSDMLENAGAKIAEKVGFDVAGAALDAIPIVGEIAGVAQIFHGLFKEVSTRKKEEKDESTVGAQVRSAGTVAVGGIDTSARQGLATVAGLV